MKILTFKGKTGDIERIVLYLLVLFAILFGLVNGSQQGKFYECLHNLEKRVIDLEKK